MMLHVYLIENPQGKIYIGFTSDLTKRLASHNQSQGPDWTQGKGPWKLIYQEDFDTETEARSREAYLKSLKAGQRLKQLLSIQNPE